MKRFLALGMALILVFSLFGSSIAYAGTTSKLNKREKAIIQAYVKSIETGDVRYIEAYMYPDLTFRNYETSDSYNINFKILEPEYSKEYIKSEKAYYLYVTGVFTVSNEYNLKLMKIRRGIFVKKKNNTEYYCFEKKVDGKDIYLDRFITIDNLTQAEINDLEEYLVSLYGEDKGKALMYPDSTSKKKSVEYKNEDEKVSITAPFGWEKDYFKNKIQNEILQISDPVNYKHLTVLKISKEYYDKDMSLKEYIESYLKSYLERNRNKMINPITGNVEQIEVNNSTAQYIVFSGAFDTLKVTYILMGIETSNYYYTLAGWTFTSNFEEYKDEMLEIMKSFKVTE